MDALALALPRHLLSPYTLQAWAEDSCVGWGQWAYRYELDVRRWSWKSKN